MNIRYLRYLRSPEWRAKRAAILKRDGHRCQLWLDHPGEEVHHRTYAHLGDEPLEDLITLCRQCHEAITAIVRAARHRRQRFKGQEHRRLLPTIETIRSPLQLLPTDTLRTVPIPIERSSTHGVSLPAVPD